MLRPSLSNTALSTPQVLVTQLVRMRYLTLTGLALTEGLVALLAQLAAVPVAALTGEDDLLELLGPGADCLVADVSTLLGVLGKLFHPNDGSAGFVRHLRTMHSA